MSATIIGFNFRATSGYVTDGTDETYVLHEAYPTTRAGWTFGWDALARLQERDRNAGIDRRLAGVHFWDITGGGGFPGIFRVDLPATGSYRIRLAAGDAYGAHTTGFAEVRDTTTALITVDFASGFTSGANFRDAVGTQYSAAAWPGSNTAADVTFATTILNLAVGKYGAVQDGWIAHLYVEQLAAPVSITIPTMIRI